MVDYTLIIGLIAAAIVTFALIPQVWKSWTTKHTKDLSWGWMGSMIVGFSLWFIYAIRKDDLPLMLTNSISWVLMLSLILMKIVFDKR